MNTHEHTLKSTISILLFVATIYLGLPILILLGIIPFAYKFYALTIGGVVVFLVLHLFGFNNHELGITTSSTKESLIAVLPVTLVLAIAGFVLWISGFSRITPNEHWSFFIFYVFISSPIQEFLYRGALDAVLDRFKASWVIRMIVTSVLYSFVHIIYRDWITLLLTLAIGLVWYSCYRKSKNLLGVSLSHAVLGVVTIVAGIID